jgi:hypothetical protein
MWAVGSLLAAETVAALLVVRPPATAQDRQKRPRVKWEYKVVQQDKIGELGDQGWEVVAVTGGQPYIESSQIQPPRIVVAGGVKEFIKNTVKYAPTFYHLKRRK